MPTTYDAGTLAPVTPSISRISSSPPEELAVVTVQADRIPWYWWLTAGAVLGYLAARMVDLGRR
jgi:hypothetical protein